MIHSLGIVHLIDVRHSLYGEEYKLLVGITITGIEGDILAQGFGFEAHEFVGHLTPLACIDVIGPGIKHLSCDASIKLARKVKQTRCLNSLRIAKLLTAECLSMVSNKS